MCSFHQSCFLLPKQTGDTSLRDNICFIYLGSCNSQCSSQLQTLFLSLSLPGQEICCSYKNVLAVGLLPSAILNAVLSALEGLTSDASLCGHQTKKILLLGLICQLCFQWSCGDSDSPPAVQHVVGERQDGDTVMMFFVYWAEKGGLCGSSCCLSCIDFYNELQESSC